MQYSITILKKLKVHWEKQLTGMKAMKGSLQINFKSKTKVNKSSLTPMISSSKPFQH